MTASYKGKNISVKSLCFQRIMQLMTKRQLLWKQIITKAFCWITFFTRRIMGIFTIMFTSLDGKIARTFFEHQV